MEHAKTMEVSSIHFAIKDGDFVRFQTLIRRKIDLNAHNRDGECPLHIAIYMNKRRSGDKMKYVSELLNAGANLESKNIYGWTPLHMAVDTNQLECVRLLTTKMNINAQTFVRGTAPLHFSVQRGLIEIVHFLLQNGADP